MTDLTSFEERLGSGWPKYMRTQWLRAAQVRGSVDKHVNRTLSFYRGGLRAVECMYGESLRPTPLRRLTEDGFVPLFSYLSFMTRRTDLPRRWEPFLCGRTAGSEERLAEWEQLGEIFPQLTGSVEERLDGGVARPLPFYDGALRVLERMRPVIDRKAEDSYDPESPMLLRYLALHAETRLLDR